MQGIVFKTFTLKFYQCVGRKRLLQQKASGTNDGKYAPNGS